MINAISYHEYNQKYADVPKAEQTIVINAADYDPEKTTAEVKVVYDYEGMPGPRFRWARPAKQPGTYIFRKPEDTQCA